MLRKTIDCFVYKNILKTKSFLCLLYFFCTVNLYSGEYKKVLILDFKNLDKNPDYQYLEGTITNAIRKNLKARFDFDEMPENEWKNLAIEHNFLWPEENHSRGFALFLGRMAKQDIGIGGHYQAIADNAGSYVIKAHVYVLDIGKKQVVSEFDMSMPTDGRLFSKIEELAERIVVEAKAVLPNKGEGSFQRVEKLSPHRFGLLAGTSVFTSPSAFAGNYNGTTALYAKDVSAPVTIVASYAYQNFFFDQAKLQINAGTRFGTQLLSVPSDTKKITMSFNDYFFAGYLGYEFSFSEFRATPLLGAGFSLANLTLDYNSLSSLPLNSQGAQLSESKLNISAPFVELAFQIDYRISNQLSLTVFSAYRQSIYIGQSIGEAFVLGGVGYGI